MTAQTDRHFVSVWNPSYADDAMERHLEVLLSLARSATERPLKPDDVYVWWGKVRSRHRKTLQKHLDETKAIDAELEKGERGETQLYLTDYRSLYVAEIDEIHFGDLPAGESAHVPAYYARNNFACDFWFRVIDIRRLVNDDLGLVIRELTPLLNLHYHNQPVSLYGGMVDLPLLVVREDGKQFFDPDERDALAGKDRLWAEFDAEVGTGVAALERDLRDNLFGDAAWLAFESITRTSIATGEKLFREHRNDTAFDFGPVLASYSKALEAQTNAALQRALRKLKPDARWANIGGRSEDLTRFRALGLGDLSHVLRGAPLSQALNEILVHGPWFTRDLPGVLARFADARNPGVHAVGVTREKASEWRNQLLGIGSAGVLAELARVRPK